MEATLDLRGNVRCMMYRDAMNHESLITFMNRLAKDAGRKALLILDNLRVHHSKNTIKWFEEHREQMEIFYPPSYSPELNLDEYLNGNLKKQSSLRDTDQKP